MEARIKRIKMVPGDITRQRVDAIFNAASKCLCRGAGVEGEIHRAADVSIGTIAAALENCGDIEDVRCGRLSDSSRPTIGRALGRLSESGAG